ncbi:MAG: glucuronyl hydrolase [Gammaproteobacteria bacterium]|nr:MAG: glucuronyl hydrolase [Gammaproteobacteria bacterium]
MSLTLTADDQLLSTSEMIGALESMFRRMEMIDNFCAHDFPLYSLRDTNTWMISSGGSWTGGFWGACWWLRAKMTESADDQRKAAAICRRLAAKIPADSGYRSLIFWYGAALGDIWFHDTQAHALAQESIAALACSFNPKLNCIPLGTAMGGLAKGDQSVSVDNFAALIQLLCSSEQNLHHYIAQHHAETTLTACRRSNGAFHASAYFDERGFLPEDQAGIWSRGQAWAMLGLSRAALRWGEPYLSHAKAACEYWQSSRPDYLPLNRLDQLEQLEDPSAAVIASLAMLSLARLLPDENEWRMHAHRQISAVIRSCYFTGFMTDSDHKNGSASVFWGCCYKTGQNREELVESVWGNFFLMAALAALTGFVDPLHC